MHNIENNIEKNNTPYQPETENEKPSEGTTVTKASQTVHGNIVESLQGTESLQETKEGYDARIRLKELFARLLEKMESEYSSVSKVVSMYLCAFNVNGNALKLEKMLHLKSQMVSDDGYKPMVKKQYEALRAALEQEDFFTNEDFERLPQLGKQKELMDLLMTGIRGRIIRLQKPINKKYLEECFRTIVLLERFPEFDEFPQFKNGPLSQFFNNNRRVIDEVCNYLEVSRQG